LSICALNTFLKIHKEELANEKEEVKKRREKNSTKAVILEALSATGLRSIRYAKEVKGMNFEIIANDLSHEAVKFINKNLKHNAVEDKVKSSSSCACALMYKSIASHKRFLAIDLDPYGNPTKFLDGAMQSIEDGGLLLITATDLAILCGNTPEACYVKYGSVPLKTKCCHEMALRILLRCLESTANRYGRYIKPLLSVSIDFYVRVFVRVFTSQAACKDSGTKQSMVFQCTGCESFTLQPLVSKKPTGNGRNFKYGWPTGPFVDGKCKNCGFKYHMGGPIWSDPIHDQNFVQQILEFVETEATHLTFYKRIFGLLNVVKEELVDIPLFYTVENLCSILKLETIPMNKFRSALLHAGYQVSSSHACKTSVKTNAPSSVLWDILRCWEKIHPVKPARKIDGTPLKAILAKEPENSYNLMENHPMAEPESKKEGLSRFPENPAPFWGPGTRAMQNVDAIKNSKSVKNQNKKTKRKKHSENEADELQCKDKLTKIE
jgi:tRNA (guanine26-N2/guanine27-N2)-dimethyltransferase